MHELGIKTGEELQSYFIKRMEQFIDAHGKKLIGWDEILEGGLPARAAVMSWRGMKGGIEAAGSGHFVVMSPGSPCYFDHSQSLSPYEPDAGGVMNSLMKVYDYYPVPEELDAAGKKYILGAQANLWTERVATFSHAEYMILPRIAALAEVDWTLPGNKDRERFIKNIGVQFDRYKALGYHYAESALTPVVDTVAFSRADHGLVLTLKNELGLYDFRYTLDGTRPDNRSALYRDSIVFDKPVELHAVCFRKGVAAGYPLIREFTIYPGRKSSVAYKYPYDRKHNGGGDKALFDKLVATRHALDRHWQGFEKNDLDVIVDMGEKVDAASVSVDFFQEFVEREVVFPVMFPKEVKISVSEDGGHYRTVLDKKYETVKDLKPLMRTVEAKFPKQKVQYVHIIGKNLGTYPGYYSGETNAWIFVDEIRVK